MKISQAHPFQLQWLHFTVYSEYFGASLKLYLSKMQKVEVILVSPLIL